jgi:toxin ParE1/3/4
MVDRPVLELVISPEARADLIRIWRYGKRRWGIEQADRFEDELWKTIQFLREYPDRGTVIRRRRRVFRSYPYPPYKIFFRVKDDIFEVLQIASDRMDPEAVIRSVRLR